MISLLPAHSSQRLYPIISIDLIISNSGFWLDTGSFRIWYKCVCGNRYYCIDLQCMCIIVKKFHVFQSGRIKQYINIGNGISVKLQLLLFCWQKHVFTFNFCFGLHTMKINTRLHVLINLYKSYVIYKGRLLLCQQTCLFVIYNIWSRFCRFFENHSDKLISKV